MPGQVGGKAEQSTSGKVLPLVPGAQHASWGASNNSLAARLHALGGRSGGRMTDGAVSAVAWGTHESAETTLLDGGQALLDYIRTEVIEVDSGKVEHYARLHRHGLPFVLRILSVGRPQALHVHPDGEDAARLHAADGARWPDPIGRAEMGVALTPVDALFGFRPAHGIVAELARVPEFADAVGRPQADAFVHTVKTRAAAASGAAALKALFTSFMQANEDHVKECLDAAVDRLRRMPKGSLTETDTLLLEVHKLHADDVMCFGVYFFNRVKLQPGEAVFIHPREPHCYLSGDLIEVASSSSNVACAGLTQQLTIDKPGFVDLLNYDDSPVEVSRGEKRDDFTTEFVPPVDEFMLSKINLPATQSLTLGVTMAPTLLSVLSGEGYIESDGERYAMCAGSSYYLRAGGTFEMTSCAPAEGMGGLHALRVGINESTAPSASCVIS